MVYRVNGPAQTQALGRALGEQLAAGDTVLLSGGLGMGKSVLARAIAGAQGVAGPMPSPTFTLMQPYAGRCALCHYDLYRLEDPEEFYAAGLDEPLGRALCLVEWPMEGVEFPSPRIIASIDRGEDSQARVITLAHEGLGARAEGLLAALSPWEPKA